MAVHVTFTPEASEALRDALAIMERNETVLAMCDDLTTGPIDVDDHRPRADWARDVLGATDDTTASIDELWRVVGALRGDVIAWMSSRDLAELCGLHELLWRLDESVHVSVVDVATIEIVGCDGVAPGQSMAFTFVFPEMIAEQDLIGRAVLLSPERREEFRANWRRLRDDNAELRILDAPGDIRSVPLAYFDDTILSCITNTWQTCARVVGESLWATSPGFVRQTCNIDYLLSRVRQLVIDGRAEGNSDVTPSTMRERRVRIP